MAKLVAQGSQVGISAVDGGPYTKIGGARGWSYSQAAARIDKTDLDSTIEETAAGMMGPAEISGDVFFDPTDSGQTTLRAAFWAKTELYFEFLFSDGTSKVRFAGIVSELGGANAVNEMAQRPCKIVSTGAVVES